MDIADRLLILSRSVRATHPDVAEAITREARDVRRLERIVNDVVADAIDDARHQEEAKARTVAALDRICKEHTKGDGL